MHHLDKAHISDKAKAPKFRNIIAGVALLASCPFCGPSISMANESAQATQGRGRIISKASIADELVSVITRSRDRNEIARAVDGLSRMVQDTSEPLSTEALVLLSRWSESARARAAAVGRLGDNPEALTEVLILSFPEDTRELALNRLILLLDNVSAGIRVGTLVDIACEVGSFATERNELDAVYSRARAMAVSRLMWNAEALADIAEYSEFEDTGRLARIYLEQLAARNP